MMARAMPLNTASMTLRNWAQDGRVPVRRLAFHARHGKPVRSLQLPVRKISLMHAMRLHPTRGRYEFDRDTGLLAVRAVESSHPCSSFPSRSATPGLSKVPEPLWQSNCPCSSDAQESSEFLLVSSKHDLP